MSLGLPPDFFNSGWLLRLWPKKFFVNNQRAARRQSCHRARQQSPTSGGRHNRQREARQQSCHAQRCDPPCRR